MALAVAAAAMAMAAGQASAAVVCTPTGFVRDGIILTAASINPGTVSGPVDATGCNIGIYYTLPGAVTNAEVYGSNYFGVLVNGTSVDIATSSIHDIGETPFNGTQHGVGVYYYGFDAAATGSVSGSAISAYQKGGIVVNGGLANVSVTDNTVTGLGEVDFIAQNGVQFGFGAAGTVRGNAISGNYYTGTAGVGPNPGGQNPPGWQYVSGGLLLYQAGKVSHSQNKYAGNQHNVLNVP